MNNKEKMLIHIKKYSHINYTAYSLSRIFNLNISYAQRLVQQLKDDNEIVTEDIIENGRFKKIIKIISD